MFKVKHDRDVWGTLKLFDLERENDLNLEMSLNSLKDIDLEKQIHYKNSAQKEFSSSGLEIVFHIINHTTYHRGQIISLLKKNAFTPN